MFGCAIVLILISALTVPWIRTYTMVREYQLEVASQVANAWLEARLPGEDVATSSGRLAQDQEGLRISFDWIEDIDTSSSNSFLPRALSAFDENPDLLHFAQPVQDNDNEIFMYARPIRASTSSRRTGQLYL